MSFFDEFCPVSSRSLKHICVILPVVSGNDEALYIKRMREFVSIYGNPLEENNRIYVATIFIDNQRDFMSEFKEISSFTTDKRSLLVMWRYEYVKAKYTWLLNIWSAEESVTHKSFDLLRSQLDLLSRGSLRMDAIGKLINLVIFFTFVELI